MIVTVGTEYTFARNRKRSVSTEKSFLDAENGRVRKETDAQPVGFGPDTASIPANEEGITHGRKEEGSKQIERWGEARGQKHR